MEEFFRYTRLSYVVAFLIVGVIVYVVQAEKPNTAGAEDMVTARAGESYSPHTESTFGFAVAGAVEARDSITVRAQTAGIIRELFAEEGDSVRARDVLLMQEVPLLASRVSLQDAQNALTNLSYDASRITYDGGEESASIQSAHASTSASLIDESIRTHIESDTSLLAAQLYGSVVVLVTALDFIDENQPYFHSKGLKEFREIVGALYGKSRTYLTGSVQYQLDSHNDILRLLDDATRDAISTDTLISLAELVDTELDAARGVFADGESDFLDARVLRTDDPLYTAYLEQRGTLVETQVSLRTLLGAVRGTQTTGNVDMFSAETVEMLHRAQLKTATDLAQNAELMQKQSESVSDALLGVLSSEGALGTPEAPFAGTVRDVFVNEGEYVMPGTPLMTLVGAGARELRVTVPNAMLPYLAIGAPFVIDAHVVGHVGRFAPMLSNGSVSVFIELTDGSYTVGDVVRGAIQCDLGDDAVIALPREYMHFNSKGIFVRTESGSDIYVRIVHDAGETLIVRPEKAITEKVTKAVGIAL